MIDVSNLAIEGHNKTKIFKNHQNIEKKLAQNHIESLPSEASEYVKSTSVFEVDVEVNLVQEQDCASEEEKGLKNDPVQQSLSPKRRRNPLPTQNRAANADQARADLVNTPSELSIVSSGSVEELHHLRSYYNKQLRRINYISQEHLQSSQPGMLTCMREPFKSLRFPSRMTISRGARNLWTRVSMRRKLIQ